MEADLVGSWLMAYAEPAYIVATNNEAQEELHNKIVDYYACGVFAGDSYQFLDFKGNGEVDYLAGDDIADRSTYNVKGDKLKMGGISGRVEWKFDLSGDKLIIYRDVTDWYKREYPDMSKVMIAITYLRNWKRKPDTFQTYVLNEYEVERIELGPFYRYNLKLSGSGSIEGNENNNCKLDLSLLVHGDVEAEGKLPAGYYSTRSQASFPNYGIGGYVKIENDAGVVFESSKSCYTMLVKQVEDACEINISVYGPRMEKSRDNRGPYYEFKFTGRIDIP